MGQLTKGILFDSDTGSSIPTQASFSNLKGGAFGSTFVENNDLLANHQGGFVLSIRPAVRPSAESVPLLEGRYLDVDIEYSNNGLQFRFLVTPTGANPIPSGWLNADNPHTLAVSYNAQPQTGVSDPGTGFLYGAVDGIGYTIPTAFVVDPYNTDTTSSTKFAPTGKFNGHLSAIAFFQELIGLSEVEFLSNNPDVWINGLKTINSPTLDWPSQAWADSAAANLTGLLGGTTLTEPTSATGQGVQVLTIPHTLSSGDQIKLSVPLAGYVEKTYTVSASDLTTPATSGNKVAENIVETLGELGGTVQLNYQDAGKDGTADSNVIVITGSNNFLSNPVNLKYVNTDGVTESALQYLYDFTGASVNPPSLGLDPTAGYAGALATNTARVSLSGGSPLVTLYSDASATTSTSATAEAFSGATTPTVNLAGAVPNGPLYSQIKEFDISGGANASPIVTYDIYIDPAYDTGGYNTFGFTASSDNTLKQVILSPGQQSILNNALQASKNQVTAQWLSSTTKTDYTVPIAQVKIALPVGGSATKGTLTFSNISVDNTFFTNASANPLTIAESVNIERFIYQGQVKQLPISLTDKALKLYHSDPNDADNIDPIPLVGTIVSYEVSDPLGAYGAKLQLASQDADGNTMDPFSPTETSSTTVTSQVTFDIIVPAGTTAYDMTLELPFNASNAVFSGGVASGSGRLLQISGSGTNASSPETIGQLTVDLNLNYGLGVDFEFASVNVNGATSTGRTSHVGLARADANGAFTAKNLIRGEIHAHLYDTTSVKNPSKVTLDDARAILRLAAAKDADMTTLASLSISPSDLIAADFNNDGRITAADAFEVLKYVAEVTKTTNLTYRFFDNIDNDPADSASYAGGLTAVFTPPLSDRLSSSQYISYNAGQDGYTANTTPTTVGPGNGPLVQYVGVLVGDVI